MTNTAVPAPPSRNSTARRCPDDLWALGERRAVELWLGGAGTAVFVMRSPPGVSKRRIIRVTCLINPGHVSPDSRHCEACWFVYPNPHAPYLERQEARTERHKQGT